MGVYYGMNVFTPKVLAVMKQLVLQWIEYHDNKEKHGRGDEGNTSNTHGSTYWGINN